MAAFFHEFGSMPWYEIIFVIAGIIACIGMFYGIWLLLKADELSDEQREKLGLGPLGQGRGRKK